MKCLKRRQKSLKIIQKSWKFDWNPQKSTKIDEVPQKSSKSWKIDENTQKSLKIHPEILKIQLKSSKIV